MKLLPGPDDHAFANASPFPVEEKKIGPVERWLGKIAHKLNSAYLKNLQNQVSAQFLARSVPGKDVRISVTARLINLGKRESVSIGNHSVIRGIIRNERAGVIQIGKEVYIGDDVIISSADRVSVGDQTLLAHGVQIFDNASHPIDWDERARHFQMAIGLSKKFQPCISSSPVIIGKNCWICMNTIVLPGTVVGDRSIIGAGSIVSGEVPPGVIYSTKNGKVEIKTIEKKQDNKQEYL